MRDTTPGRIWTTTLIALLHVWAVRGVVDWVPLVRAMAESLRSGAGGLLATIGTVDSRHFAGLMTVCAVVVADVWSLASTWRTDDGLHGGKESVQAHSVFRPRWTRGIAVAGMLALLIAFVFSLTPSTKVFASLCAVTAAAVGSAFLLVLRANAGNRVRDRMASAQNHLDSAVEHLNAIESYRKRASTAM